MLSSGASSLEKLHSGDSAFVCRSMHCSSGLSQCECASHLVLEGVVEEDRIPAGVGRYLICSVCLLRFICDFEERQDVVISRDGIMRVR